MSDATDQSRFEELLSASAGVIRACRYCGADPGRPVVPVGSLFVALPVLSQNSIDVSNRHGGRRQYRVLRDDYCLAIRSWCLGKRLRTWTAITPGERRVEKTAGLAAARALRSGREPRWRRVLITRYYGTDERLFDYANLVGGCKPLLDALVLEGLLFDDRVKWCEDHYRQESHASLRGAGIMVEEDG